MERKMVSLIGFMERKMVSLIGFGVLGFFTLLVMLSSCASVGAGERGVQLQQGAVTGTVLEPGWHLQVPIVQSVKNIDVQIQAYHVKASAASKNLQAVDTEVTLTYELDKSQVTEIWRRLGQGYEGRVIAPAVQEQVKAVTADFNADQLLVERPRVRAELETSLRDYLKQFNILVVAVQITNFDFSEEFNTAIEQKQVAEQNILVERNKLEQVRVTTQAQVAQAEAAAQATIAIAKGEAEATTLRGNAEATAIRVRAEALFANPRLIDLELAQKWNGKGPDTVLGGTTAAPFIMLPAR